MRTRKHYPIEPQPRRTLRSNSKSSKMSDPIGFESFGDGSNELASQRKVNHGSPRALRNRPPATAPVDDSDECIDGISQYPDGTRINEEDIPSYRTSPVVQRRNTSQQEADVDNSLLKYPEFDSKFGRKFIPESSQFKPERKYDHIPERTQVVQNEGIEERTHEKKSPLLVLGILALFIISYYFYPFHSPQSVVENEDNPLDKLRKEVKEIKKQFPAQVDDLWPSFVAGINKIIMEDPMTPSTFLMLHQGDKGTSECLALKLGEIAAKVLNNLNKEPIVINGLDLKNNETILNDHGEFTVAYQPVVEDVGVMIVNNLQEIPGTIAQTFHTFCDEINPLVKKAVYIFTLKTEFMDDETLLSKIARDTLVRLWGPELSKDIMHPLITRVTNEVLAIRPERKLLCS